MQINLFSDLNSTRQQSLIVYLFIRLFVEGCLCDFREDLQIARIKFSPTTENTRRNLFINLSSRQTLKDASPCFSVCVCVYVCGSIYIYVYVCRWSMVLVLSRQSQTSTAHVNTDHVCTAARVATFCTCDNRKPLTEWCCAPWPVPTRHSVLCGSDFILVDPDSGGGDGCGEVMGTIATCKSRWHQLAHPAIHPPC